MAVPQAAVLDGGGIPRVSTPPDGRRRREAATRRAGRMRPPAAGPKAARERVGGGFRGRSARRAAAGSSASPRAPRPRVPQPRPHGRRHSCRAGTRHTDDVPRRRKRLRRGRTETCSDVAATADASGRGAERAGDPEVARVEPNDLLAAMKDAAVARPSTSERDRFDVTRRRDTVAGRHHVALVLRSCHRGGQWACGVWIGSASLRPAWAE